MSDPKRYHLYAGLQCEAFTTAKAVLMFSEEEDGMWVKWQDYARLKAEVERLTVAADWKTPARKIQALEEENERLRKAGDAMVDELQMLEEVVRFKRHQTTMDCRKENPRVKAWNAAKEGKPSV